MEVEELWRLKRVSDCPVGEGGGWGGGAAEGARHRVAEPHPITRSFLVGREPRKSAFSLSFINLTTCAKSPSIRVNQTDTGTLAAVFWVTREAHPEAEGTHVKYAYGCSSAITYINTLRRSSAAAMTT